MSLWSKYAKERFGVECFETEYGFLTYQREDDCLMICDFFVDPDHRRSGEGRKLFDVLSEHAVKLGCNEIGGMVWPRAKGAEFVLLIALRGGFKIRHTENGGIRISREITHG